MPDRTRCYGDVDADGCGSDGGEMTGETQDTDSGLRADPSLRSKFGTSQNRLPFFTQLMTFRVLSSQSSEAVSCLLWLIQCNSRYPHMRELQMPCLRQLLLLLRWPLCQSHKRGNMMIICTEGGILTTCSSTESKASLTYRSYRKTQCLLPSP